MATMLAGHPARARWSPATPAEREYVRSELETILSSIHFCNSKRYPALLRYVVEHTLNGDTNNIKERTLGIEVFGRPASYDTNSDTIVRYTAGEVRRRLATYYHEHEDSPVQITLPTGSYIPEFLRAAEEVSSPQEVIPLPAEAPLPPPEMPPMPTATPVRGLRPVLWALPLLAVLAVSVWFFLHVHQSETAAIDRFWAPVLREKKVPLLVSGGVVFNNNQYSGTQTADRSIDYPFVSMQVAAALARVSGIIQRKGGDVQVLPANTTTLSDLRDRPVILVGGYNNDWTLRLLETLPIHLGPVDRPAILDSASPSHRWERDHSLPYSSSDDFALVGRYRDATTGSVTVIIAGLGRNGTEAAAQFLTEPHYMQELESRLGKRISDANVEAVLKISVIQGRTGAPSILAVHSW